MSEATSRTAAKLRQAQKDIAAPLETLHVLRKERSCRVAD
jgi:hypothetical protein